MIEVGIKFQKGRGEGENTNLKKEITKCYRVRKMVILIPIFLEYRQNFLPQTGGFWVKMW